MLLSIVALWSMAWMNVADGSTSPEVQWHTEAAAFSTPPGSTVELVSVLNIPAGWYVYWTDPGASGAPTSFEFASPTPGVIFGQPRFQRPQVFSTKLGRVYGYEKQLVVAVQASVPDTVPLGSTIKIDVLGDWLLCREACFIGGGAQSITIQVGQDDAPTNAARLLHLIPQAITSRPETQVHWDQRTGTLSMTGPASTKGPPRVLIDRVPGVEVGQASVDLHGDRFQLSLPVQLVSADSVGQPPRVRGLLTFGPSRYDPSWSFDIACDVDDQ